jgi:hypothetical protein
MSVTLAALICTLIATGMTSAVQHQFTLVGGCLAATVYAGCGLLSRQAMIYPFFACGAVLLSTLALISSEANTAEFTSTIHVLSSYLALVALGVSSKDLSSFCRQFILSTNLLLTGWILYQATQVTAVEAWAISNPSGAGNLMAAQINMTLPLVLSYFSAASGTGRIPWLILAGLNIVAVFLVMSRNGVGALLIILTLYFLFNRKRLAVLTVLVIGITGVFIDQIIRSPVIFDLLVRMRIINFVPRAPRSVIWQISWDHIQAHSMLGVGPGEPRKILAVLDINHAHNNIVQVAFETGIPSSIIFTLMMASLLWLPVSMVWRSREAFVHTLPIVAYLIFSWTGGPLAFSGATLLLAACVNEARIGVLLMDSERRRMAQRAPTQPAPARPDSIWQTGQPRRSAG